MSDERPEGADARRWSAHQIGANAFAWTAFGPHGAASGTAQTQEEAEAEARTFAEDGLPGTEGAPDDD